MLYPVQVFVILHYCRSKYMIIVIHCYLIYMVIVIVNSSTFLLFYIIVGANILRGVAGAGVLAGFDSFKALYIKWRVG